MHVSSHITSQSLSTLSVIEDFLSKRPMPSGIASSEPRSQIWVRNLNYYSESSSLSSLSLSLCLHFPPRKLQNADGLLGFSVVSQLFICLPFLLEPCYVPLCCCCVTETMACMSLGLDGSTSASERERLINQFNDPENNTAWIFLLSTRCRPPLSVFPNIY